MIQCNQPRNPLMSIEKLGHQQLVSTSSRSLHQRCYANSHLKKLAALMWREQPRRESRLMKRRPEPVARARERTRNSCGVQSRIDAAEEDIEAGPYQIRNVSSSCSATLILRTI